jgi:hypothetical protein
MTSRSLICLLENQNGGKLQNEFLENFRIAPPPRVSRVDKFKFNSSGALNRLVVNSRKAPQRDSSLVLRSGENHWL